MECAPRTSLKDILPTDQIPERKCQFDKIISFGGNWASGSSIVGNFLNEFSNIDVVGQIYTGENSYKKQGGELHFFVTTWFNRFTKLPYCATDAEKDIIIKNFINDIYKCYKKKMVAGEIYSPHIYNEKFLQICMDLMLSVLDLTEHDMEILKNKNFPLSYHPDKPVYDRCSFVKGEGKYKHIFYRLKPVPLYEFGLAVRRFIEDFFNLYYKEKKILAGDQLGYNQTRLETLNYYLFDSPIRQISVYRDPRDQFFSMFRHQLLSSTPYIINIPTFINFYKRSRELDYVTKNPYEKNMIIRFEDMIVKYNEFSSRIVEFLDLDPALHIHRKKFFDPAISVNNIGCYKLFSDQKIMQEIEEGLSEFCFYPEKENLSDEAWKLLNSRTFFIDRN